jgi:hypothetical protein
MKNLKAYRTKNKSKYVETKLKEYDNFKKLITNFIKKKYKYVSYVHGGFEKIHEESLKFKIPLLNHDDNCYLCKKKIKRKDSFSNGILKGKSLQNFFSFGKNSNKKESSPKKNIEKSKTDINENKLLEKNTNLANNKNNTAESNNNNKDIKENKETKKGFFSNLFSRKKSNISNSDLKKDEKKDEKISTPVNKYKFNEEKCKFEIEFDKDINNNNNDKFDLDKSEMNIKSNIIIFNLSSF